MIETSLMVDDYPTPPNNSKTIKGRIELTYSFEVEVPDNWDRDRIEEDIRENHHQATQYYGENEWVTEDILRPVDIFLAQNNRHPRPSSYAYQGTESVYDVHHRHGDGKSGNG